MLASTRRPRPESSSAQNEAVESSDLGASALAPQRKYGNNNRKKPLQLQFSFQEQSDYDDDNEDESVFLEHHRGPGCSGCGLLSEDEDDELTTSPSLTFGVNQEQEKGDYRALALAEAESHPLRPSASEVVAGTKKKSYSSRRTEPRVVGKRRKASPTAVAVVSAASNSLRIENGEIRPLCSDNMALNEEDEEDFEDDNPAGARRVASSKAHRSNASDNHLVNNSNGRLNGGNGHGLGPNAGPPPPAAPAATTSTKDKDELNHIIPESKKFPQVHRKIT